MTAPVLSARMAAVLRAAGAGESMAYSVYGWHVGSTRLQQNTIAALVDRDLITIGPPGRAVLSDAGRAWLDAEAGAETEAQSGANVGEE